MEDIVTVVIPTYKRPDRIVRAVKSVLNQTYNNIEIIIVDDNGINTEMANRTWKELENIVDNHKVKYFCNEVNSGGSYSRNVGLINSSGKYITFLDDDDEIMPEKIKKQVNLLEKLGDKYKSVYTSYHKILENGKVYKSAEKVQGDLYQYALSRSVYLGSGSNLLVYTELAKEIGGYDVSFKRNQDLEFFTRICEKTNIAFVDDDLLKIHYEIREIKKSYMDLVSIDNFYLEKFKIRINQLDNKTQKKVYDIFALERLRYSIGRDFIDGIKNVINNKVSLSRIIKYLVYLIDRILYKKSYGFKGWIKWILLFHRKREISFLLLGHL